MSENKEFIKDQELDNVSGGQGDNTSEKEVDYNDLYCPYCYEKAVYKVMYVDVKYGGNSISYGPWQCRRCGHKWSGSYYKDSFKGNVWKEFKEA